ncbi:tyrosine-type recombinase/integrase [Aliidiomarina haloalkalitolerans]|uniref:Integrase n=1 Tax=Aliidiomarina haloalkalitolerans TaxID=859059 RepID=A0A432VPH3_9GAMM|nr:integrase arm-type DNA-binding domain-containing protein [Aliidiomarina haloalkalitolerans]RUO18049.1 integrase [Aliidiomarina haloalkalitolerans]
MPLTQAQIKNAKPKSKVYKLFDGGGLYLQVKPTGYKAFKYDYRIDGTRGTYVIGEYPLHSLKEARELHMEARKLVDKGIHPKSHRDELRIQDSHNSKRFSQYAEEWVSKLNLAETTEKDLRQRIEKNLYPYMDKKPMGQFTTIEIFDILKKVSDRGAVETAVRLASVLKRIYDELLILRLIDTNPAAGVATLLPKRRKGVDQNFGNIQDEKELASLLHQIHNPRSRQDYAVTQALKLMPLVFLRPRNIRFLKWEYVDFEDKLIRIPASEMKSRKPHDVPLANQAIEILRDIQQLTGKKELVFVATKGINKGLSENTTTKALQRLINPNTGEPFGSGYVTSHGFRHTASTHLRELGYESDIVELQLAHVKRDKVEAAYNKAKLMSRRREMMQAWADYLDDLRKQHEQ